MKMVNISEDEFSIGNSFNDCAAVAIKRAADNDCPCTFSFNGIPVVVTGKTTPEDAMKDYIRIGDEKHKAYLESDEYKQRLAAEADAEIKRHGDFLHLCGQLKTMSELEFQAIAAPWPRRRDELDAFITALADRTQDYGTCVYAMSLSALATFNFMASTVGASGFQASMASLNFFKLARSIECPFMITRIEDALYPQYDLHGKLQEFIDECKPWMKERAQKLLEDNDATAVNPKVLAHWKKLLGVKG